jgi:hypothetical protein
MIRQTPHVGRFQQQLRESLRQEAVHGHVVTITKDANVYTCGDQDETVYFIQSGANRRLMSSRRRCGSQCRGVCGGKLLAGVRYRRMAASAAQRDNPRVS